MVNPYLRTSPLKRLNSSAFFSLVTIIPPRPNQYGQSINLSKNIIGCKILWASPREFLNIFQAEDAGCHIITLAPDLISKVKNYNKNLDEFSLETVKMFFNDAQNAGYKI